VTIIFKIKFPCLKSTTPKIGHGSDASSVDRDRRLLKPNSITLAGSKLVRSWSQTGSKPNSITLSGSELVQSWFEAASEQLRTSSEPASNQLAEWNLAFIERRTCCHFAGVRVLVAVARDAAGERTGSGRITAISGSAGLAELSDVSIRTCTLLDGARRTRAASFARRLQLHVVQESHA